MSMYDYAGAKVTVNIFDYADWEEDYEDEDDLYDEEDEDEESAEDCAEDSAEDSADEENNAEDGDSSDEEDSSGHYSAFLCELPYADIFGYSPENEGEEDDWSISIYLTFSLDREGRIGDIGYTARVYGGEGLGDVDESECWCDTIDKEGEAFFKKLTAPQEEA